MPILRPVARACALALAMGPLPLCAQPGNSVTFTGTVQAELVNPGRLALLEDLRFGAFMQPAAPATLTVAPDGSASGTGEIATTMSIPQPAEGRGPARFRLDGTENRAFVAIIPNRITISNGTATMEVRNITTNMRNGSNRFDATGQFILAVGGTLRANANQAPGEYAGDFRITVIFQ
jgi:hypothetical protein